MKIILTYKNAGILASVINMYCNGPQYNFVMESLSESKKEEANQISQCLFMMKDKMREENPELYASRPYSTEALNKTHEFSLTSEEIQMLLTIFEETIEESKVDNFYELELLASPIDDVRHVYNLLLELK